MGMKELWNGPSFFWNGVEDGSGQHFWGGRLEWKAFQKIRMVPQSACRYVCLPISRRSIFITVIELLDEIMKHQRVPCYAVKAAAVIVCLGA